MEIWSPRWNKPGFLSCKYRESTTVWMHFLGSNKTHRERTRWQLHKNATCYYWDAYTCLHIYRYTYIYTHINTCVFIYKWIYIYIYIYVCVCVCVCFFQATVMFILLNGCTTWTLKKRMEKKLDGNYTRMLRAIFNKSWRQHPTKQQLYGHRPPITKTIKIRQTRHARLCWRSWDGLISDILLWTHSHGQAESGRPARTYILCRYRI